MKLIKAVGQNVWSVRLEPPEAWAADIYLGRLDGATVWKSDFFPRSWFWKKSSQFIQAKRQMRADLKEHHIALWPIQSFRYNTKIFKGYKRVTKFLLEKYFLNSQLEKCSSRSSIPRSHLFRTVDGAGLRKNLTYSWISLIRIFIIRIFLWLEHMWSHRS